MAEMALLTNPCVIPHDITEHALNAERVIGVTAFDGTTVLEHGLRTSEVDQEQIVDLPYDEAERIIDFFAQTFALPPTERLFYNCHSFAFFVVGKIAELKHYERYDVEPTLTRAEPSNSTHYMPGEVYGAVSEGGIIDHSVLAIGESGSTLSVLGDNNPLVVASADDVLLFYGSAYYRHVKPVCTIW